MKPITYEHIKAAFKLLKEDGVTDPDEVYFSIVKTLVRPTDYETEYEYFLALRDVIAWIAVHNSFLQHPELLGKMLFVGNEYFTSLKAQQA